MKALSDSVFKSSLWLDMKNNEPKLLGFEKFVTGMASRFVREMVSGDLVPTLDNEILEAEKFRVVVAVSIEPCDEPHAEEKGGEK